MNQKTLANKYRNPNTPLLRQYALKKGAALVDSCGIEGARYVLGGSLGYDAALKGDYDIDLRLLIPDADKSQEEVKREIVSVKDLLVEQAKGDPSFNVKFIDEGGTNYIWHTKQIVKVPGIPGDPDIKLTWNIQAESAYRCIAEMAVKLPKYVIDKYVVAKWTAKQKSDEAYRALKRQWMDFIEWLISNEKGSEGEALLEAAEKEDKLPPFLKQDE